MAESAAVEPMATGLTERRQRAAPGTAARIRAAFTDSPPAMLSLLALATVLLIAIGAPLVGRYDPTATDLTASGLSTVPTTVPVSAAAASGTVSRSAMDRMTTCPPA